MKTPSLIQQLMKSKKTFNVFQKINILDKSPTQYWITKIDKSSIATGSITASKQCVLKS